MTWVEIFADDDGFIVVERHSKGWVFEPTGKVGRPPKSSAEFKGRDVVLPPDVFIDSWRVANRSVLASVLWWTEKQGIS